MRQPLQLSRTEMLRALPVAALALGLVGALPAAVESQGTVTGRITITERPGEQSTDLGNTVIYLMRTDSATPSPRVVSANVGMNQRTFVPRVQVITPGGKVAFPNQDPFSHNIFSTTRGAVFDLGLYPSGQSKDYTFRRPGAFPVYCNIHPRMTAFVVAVPTPWYTQAGADGRWTIPNVPPGEYVLHVWHERAPEHEQPITVLAAGRAGTDVTLDARGFRFAQHRNKFGQEYDRTGRDRY